MAFSKLPKALRAYILAHFVALGPVLWLVLQRPQPESWAVGYALLLATAVAGSWKLELTIFQGRMSVVFAVACLALLLEGGTAAVACAALGAFVTTVVRAPQGKWRLSLQRQPLHRLLFNPVHCALVCGLATLAFYQVLPLAPAGWAGRMCGLIVFTSIYFFANSYGIAYAVGLQQGLAPTVVWRENFLWTAPGFFASALAATVIWGTVGVMGAWALLLVAPLYVIYYSGWLYLHRLEKTNDSLKEQVAERERAEAELRKEREFLQAVLEHVSDGILATDADGRVTQANRSSRELTGLPDPRVGALPETLARGLRGELIRDAEVHIAPEGAAARHLLGTSQTIRDPEGHRQGAVLVLRDVTQQKQAAEARERLIREQAARAAAEAGRKRITFLAEASTILASSLDYETTLANVAKLCVPDLAQSCMIDLLHSDGTLRCLASVQAPVEASLQELGSYRLTSLAESHPIREALQSGRTQSGKGAIQHPGGVEAFGAASTSYLCCPLVARGHTLGVIVFLSVSDGRCFTEEDEALAQDLAGRAALAVDNARLYQEVQEHDRRKDIFLAMLGHELRNPLAAMSNSLEVLRLRGAWDSPNAEALAVLDRQTRHQARLIDDLLDVSRITQGKVQLRTDRVELTRIAALAVETARPFIEGSGHTLHLEVSNTAIWLEADPTRLEQVMVNLLNNAAKYTDRGGTIWLTVERAQGSGAWAVIRVRDTGIGMTPELSQRVFDVFAQAPDALQRAQGGLGLGLSLVRGLVDLHGGRVEARSDGEGRGSEFTVYLPAYTGVHLACAEAQLNPETASRPSTLQVLVVDDNVDAAEMTVEVLELWGYAADSVHSGASALRTVEQRMPDLILMDIGMPGMDGYTVTRELRRRPGGRIPYIIALTGYGQRDDVQRALAAGMDAHLTKPVDLDALRRLLHGAEATRPRPSEAA